MDNLGFMKLGLHGKLKREDFLIPTYIFTRQDDHGEKPHPPPACPVVVFINSRSGGQLGGELIKTYRQILSDDQVFDLGENAPDKVLQQLYANLESLRSNDSLAEYIIQNLRLVVAGGDGTASWLLGVVCDLKLPRPPPVATVPLGTGNNLPFSFGWGKKNPGTDKRSAEQFLLHVQEAKAMDIDNWHVIMRMKSTKKDSYNPVAPALPYAMHAFHRLSSSDSLSQEGHLTFRGGFWNYFSMGMDAQVSYAFHSERKLHPEKFKNQLANQSTYLKLGCSQGWFKPSVGNDETRSISQMAKIKVKKEVNSEWEDLEIPNSIRSIVCLNLPSFSGGLNPWGTPDTRKPRFKSFTPPFVDDGRIEVVGFRDAWHGLVLLSSKGHGTRLAQAHRIKFEFHRGTANHTYMRLDGEPWEQPLPTGDEERVELEISHHGQVSMLALPNCRSKSVNNGDAPNNSNPSTPQADDSDEDASEERRKFGAAETFKLPDGIDIAHLS